MSNSSATLQVQGYDMINIHTAFAKSVLDFSNISLMNEWGDRIIDQLYFQMVLTFDFATPEPFPEPPTTKRARREFNL